MKIIQLVLFWAIGILCFSQASAQQLNESFEGSTFPPSGWTTSDVMGATTWSSSTDEAHSGSQSAFINYEATGPGEDWLKTPQIFSVKSGDNVTFWIKNQFTQPYPPDNLEILISTTNNQNPSFTNSIGNIDVSTLLSGTWVQYSYSLTAFAGQNIYIAFKHSDNIGSGMYLDDVTAGSLLTNDATSKGLKATPSAIVVPGTSVTFVDTVRNAGSNTLASGVPVKYSVNNGSAIAGGSTSASITSGSTTNVSFSYIPPAAGVYTIKVFTALAGDVNTVNDTVTYTLNVQQPITAFPFFENFSNPILWTLSGNISWDMLLVTNPSGSNNDNAARARFFNTGFGQIMYLQSPLFDFSSNAKPMVDFYVAYRSFSNQNDRLEVVVSADGGTTFQAAPLLYNKSYSTRLSTIGNDPAMLEYVPASGNDWRHEAVDLSAYGGMSNVLIAFKATSAVGNNLYIDNVNVINQSAALYTTTTITTPAQVATGPFNTKVKFTTIGNAAGGITKFQGNSNVPPVNAFSPNTTAASNDGSISSPNMVYPQYTTITYTGNDSVKATYDVSLDITGMGVIAPDKAYIVKRADQSGLWIAYPTTRVGNILTAAGFNKFSDFAVATYLTTLPLTLISFDGDLVNNKVNLRWQTSNDTNVNGFDIERMTGNTWDKIGFVKSLGTVAIVNNYTFTDDKPQNGINYYRLKIIDNDGKTIYSSIINFDLKITKPAIYQNVPNPFKTITTIRYDLAEKAAVKITMYNVHGALLEVAVDEVKEAGSYQLIFHGDNLPPGNYFYKVIIGDEVVTKKMIKLR